MPKAGTRPAPTVVTPRFAMMREKKLTLVGMAARIDQGVSYSGAGVNRRGRATREKIINATKRLLRDQGYSRTTIDDICKAAGVKRGNLYFHFTSKHDLACQAVEDSGNRYLPFFQTLMEEEADPLAKIELLIDRIVGYFAARGGKAT